MDKKVTLYWERDGMVVYPHDNFLRFRVTSQTQSELEYVVQLDSYVCNGECTCQDFECRHRPVISRPGPTGGRVEGSNDTRCKHIKLCREVMLDAFILQCVANEKEAARRAKLDR